MVGFLSDKLDELLGLEGYKSTIILPLGYRNQEDDWLVNMKKVRTPRKNFIQEMTLADTAQTAESVVEQMV